MRVASTRSAYVPARVPTPSIGREPTATQAVVPMPVEPPWAPCSWTGRLRQAKDGVEDVRHACQTGPILTGEDADATHEWQHGRQPDTRTDTLGARGGRPEQVTDPAGEQLEVFLADARPLRVGSLSGLGTIATSR